MANTDHPKMLYKGGSEIIFQDAPLDTLIVEDADAEAAARKNGYADLGDALAPPAKPKAKA